MLLIAFILFYIYISVDALLCRPGSVLPDTSRCPGKIQPTCPGVRLLVQIVNLHNYSDRPHTKRSHGADDVIYLCVCVQHYRAPMFLDNLSGSLQSAAAAAAAASSSALVSSSSSHYDPHAGPSAHEACVVTGGGGGGASSISDIISLD